MFKYHQDKNNVSDQQVMKSLPQNRKEVFFDLLSHRKMTLFALSCFTFMFFIPLAVDLFIFNYLESVAIAADKKEYLFSLVFYSMCIMLPCMVIGFLAWLLGSLALRVLSTLRNAWYGKKISISLWISSMGLKRTGSTLLLMERYLE